MTRRQYWINEIGWPITRFIWRTGSGCQKHCAPMMSRFRRTHWRRWRLPKTRPVQACSLPFHLNACVARGNPLSGVSHKNHRAIRTTALGVHTDGVEGCRSRGPCRLAAKILTWTHVLHEATHAQIVSCKTHWTIRPAALRLEFNEKTWTKLIT